MELYPQGTGMLRVRLGIAFGVVFLYYGFLPGLKRGSVKYVAFFKQGTLRPPSLVCSAAKVQEPGGRANELCMGYKLPVDMVYCPFYSKRC